MRLIATYVGGMDGAVVPSLPSGRTVTGMRDVPVEILESERAALEAHPEWTVEQEQEQDEAEHSAEQDEETGI